MPLPSSTAADRYLTDRVMTASPAELTAMLYDALSASVRGGLSTLEAGSRIDALPRLHKAMDILLELRCTLDHSAGPLAGSLDGLYAFAWSRLVQAATTGDAGPRARGPRRRRAAAHRLAAGLPGPGRLSRARPPVTAWPALLDALEERTRRVAEALDAGAVPDPVELDLDGAGPLPPALAVRVAVLLAETERLAGELARRTGPAARAAAAYASH